MEKLLDRVITRLIGVLRKNNNIDDDMLDHLHGVIDGFKAAYTQAIHDTGHDVEFHVENGKYTAITVNGKTYTV